MQTMTILFSVNQFKETQKAAGFWIRHNGKSKIMWIPIAQIEKIKDNKNWRSRGCVEVLEWLYDKKFRELFPVQS